MTTTPQIPSAREPIAIGLSNALSVTWFRFISDLRKWVGTALPVSAITVGNSPYSYVNNSSYGSVVVNGGTVSAIDLSRDATTFYTTGQTAGVFPLAPGDTLRVTWSIKPTMTFFPR